MVDAGCARHHRNRPGGAEDGFHQGELQVSSARESCHFFSCLCCKMFVCSLVSRAVALMPLYKALNKARASLLLCETHYIWGHPEVYLSHLFDVLWEAYLHTEEAVCKAQADQPDFPPVLLQTSKSSARPQRFHTVRKSAHYTAGITFPENFQMYLRCSCPTAALCYHYSEVECEGSRPRVWKENKKLRWKSDLQIKKASFFFNLTKHENRTCC